MFLRGEAPLAPPNVVQVVANKRCAFPMYYLKLCLPNYQMINQKPSQPCAFGLSCSSSANNKTITDQLQCCVLTFVVILITNQGIQSAALAAAVFPFLLLGGGRVVVVNDLRLGRGLGVLHLHLSISLGRTPRDAEASDSQAVVMRTRWVVATKACLGSWSEKETSARLSLSRLVEVLARSIVTKRWRTLAAVTVASAALRTAEFALSFLPILAADVGR